MPKEQIHLEEYYLTFYEKNFGSCHNPDSPRCTNVRKKPGKSFVIVSKLEIYEKSKNKTTATEKGLLVEILETRDSIAIKSIVHNFIL